MKNKRKKTYNVIIKNDIWYKKSQFDSSELSGWGTKTLEERDSHRMFQGRGNFKDTVFKF